jgi:hypothetical protein
VLHQLQSESGKGCFEEAVDYLIRVGDLPEEVLDD